ncbi:MAG: hypothetical protein HZC54_13410 [Verrucomicrobia bacterium]|nr:hypothetical protein [Verrucomicrobiota bacterium]
MVNLSDIVTFVYGVVGFAIGWLWGRHRSNAASFMASVIVGAAGFAVGKGLEWVQILTESWIDKLGQSYKFLGTSANVLANVIWCAVIIAIPAIAIAAFRKTDRRPAAE